MLTKTKLIETIGSFPEKFTVDELIERIILIDKIERGNEQSEKGQTISDEVLDQDVQYWFK